MESVRGVVGGEEEREEEGVREEGERECDGGDGGGGDGVDSATGQSAIAR